MTDTTERLQQMWPGDVLRTPEIKQKQVKEQILIKGRERQTQKSPSQNKQIGSAQKRGTNKMTLKFN